MKEEEKLLEDYIGGRLLNDDVKSILFPLIEPINETLYRGMMLPKHILEKDLLIEEWYGCSHWTLDFSIARNFSLEPCPSDDYVEGVAYDLDLSFDEAYETFVPVILRMKGTNSGVRIYKLASKYEATKIYVKEQEVSTFGMNSIVTDIKEYSDNNGTCYILDVAGVR